MENPSDHSPPERFNIARYCLAAHAAARPDKTALIVVGGGQERRWCYGELDRAVRRLAGGFRRLGLAPGARLIIRIDNDLPYILTFFAALAAGLVPLPSSAALTGEEAEFTSRAGHRRRNCVSTTPRRRSSLSCAG